MRPRLFIFIVFFFGFVNKLEIILIFPGLRHFYKNYWLWINSGIKNWDCRKKLTNFKWVIVQIVGKTPQTAKVVNFVYIFFFNYFFAKWPSLTHSRWMGWGGCSPLGGQCHISLATLILVFLFPDRLTLYILKTC